MEINCFETDLELFSIFIYKQNKKKTTTTNKWEKGKKRKTSSSNTLSITIITDLI